MGKGKGIVLEFGASPDEMDDGDDWDDAEGDMPPERPEDARPPRDPHALLEGIQKNLDEMRTFLADTDY
jgi:hypothetical protein